MTDLAHGEQAAVMPVTGFHGLPINPAGSVRIPLDLVVLPQRLRAHGPALNQEHLDLAQDQRVTFQRGGVMRLLMPDVGPDRLGLLRAGRAPETLIQLSQGMAEPFVDTGPTRSAYYPPQELRSRADESWYIGFKAN